MDRSDRRVWSVEGHIGGHRVVVRWCVPSGQGSESMEWADLAVLRQEAEQAAVNREPVVLSGPQVLGLLDAIDAAQLEASVYQDEITELERELEHAQAAQQDAEAELQELRAAMGSV